MTTQRWNDEMRESITELRKSILCPFPLFGLQMINTDIPQAHKIRQRFVAQI